MHRFPVLLSVIYFVTFFSATGCGRPPAISRPLPEFALTAVTVDGASPLTRAELRGRPWVASFVFTRCTGPCPLLTAHMAALQKKLPERVGLLSFSVDPDHDSPELLTTYARRFKADPQRWWFVTGEKTELARLIKEGFLLPVAENAAAAPGERVAHSTKFVLLDRDANVRGWYDGEDPAALEKLAADAGRL